MYLPASWLSPEGLLAPPKMYSLEIPLNVAIAFLHDKWKDSFK